MSPDPGTVPYTDIQKETEHGCIEEELLRQIFEVIERPRRTELVEQTIFIFQEAIQ